MTKKKIATTEVVLKADKEFQLELDEQSMGESRLHFVFPAGAKLPYDRANLPVFTGGIYVKKGAELPETITLVFPKVKEEKA